MKFLKTSLFSLLLSAALIPVQSYSQIVRIPFAMGAAQVVAQTFEFGDVQVGQYVTTTFTYKNGSPLELTILGTTSDNVDLIGSDCPTTLAAQDVCHITIGMLVVDEGPNQGQVRIKNDQNAQEDVLNVTANGVTSGNILTVNPAMQLFSIVNQEQEFTVTNNQVYDITIGNVLMSNNYWTISKNACIGTLTAGNSCKVSAKYVNKKTGGYTGILKVLSQSVMVGSANLSGNTALGVPSFSSDSISAQDLKINEVYQNSVVLKNSGVGGMIINSVALDAPTSAFSVTANSCSGKTLAPNETCNVSFQIQFTAPDVLQRSLVFNLSNSSTSAAYLNVYASAVANTAILNPMPGSLTFSAQSKTATSAPLTVNLQSIGTAAVTVSDIFITGKDAALFSLTNKASCLGSLSPEMQCALSVVYGPSNAVGNHTASIGFTSDATTPTNTVLLTGVTVAPTLSALPTKASFTGTIGVDQFQTISITNSSLVETVIGAISSDNANIVTSGSGCTTGATLSAGESCSLKITLKNTTPIGSQSSKVTVAHSGDPLVVPVDYTLSAFKIDPIVSEISCPTVSRSVNTSGSATAAAASDYCSFTIKNPSVSSTIYVATSGVAKVSGSALFSNSSALTNTLSIDPGITSTIKIPYQVSNSAGTYNADYSITSSTNLSIPANSSTITKTATLNVLAEAYELSAVSCPASVSLGGAVNCTARLANKSLSAYSLLIPYASKNIVYAAAKFSETTLNGTALSSAIADRPVDDFSPTTTNFRWTTSVTGCSAGSAASVGVANSGYCDLSITFNPAKVGSYVVPLYGIWGSSTTNAFKGTTNASFSVVETVSGNLSAVTCPKIVVGASANCTATLTNPSTQTALAVSGVNLTPDATGTFSSATSNCGASVAAGATCTITIPATGLSAGNFTATLSVVTSAGPYTSPANITVDLATPSVALYAFSCPTVIENEATTCTSTIKNNGSSAYNITNISLAKTTVGFGLVSSSSMALAPGASANLTLPFVNAVAGTYTSAVTLTATGYTDISTNATAIVNAAPAPVGTLSALVCSSLSFGQSGLCTATLKNTSSIKALTVGTISTTGSNSIFGANSSTCGTSLSADANCTITIPVSGAMVGSFPVTLSVVTNPNLSQSSSVTVNPLVFSVTSPAAASTVAGSPVTLKTLFTNKNAFNVFIPTGSITLSGSGYKIVANSCENVSLTVDQTCSVDATYSGSVIGVYKGSLTLKYGGATVVGDLNTSVITPSIGIAPLDGVVTKASGFRSLSGTWYVVSNSNPVSLTIASISMLNANSTAIALQSIAGSCYVGQTLQPNEQCLVFERYNLSSMGAVTTVTNTNTGTIKSTTNISAAWSSSFVTQKGTFTIDKTAATIAPTDTYTGTVTFSNLGVSPVKNLTITRTADSTVGVFSLGSGNCSGIIAAGATCSQTFSIQGLPAGSTVLGLDIKGVYQTIVNDKLTQDWGESAVISVAPAKVTLTVVAPTGLVSTGAYGDGSTATSLFTNKSTYPVTVTGVDISNATDQSISGSTCLNSTVPALGTCEITTSRQNQSGNLDFVRTPATLTVTVNGQYPFTGTIVSSPVLSNSINFGEVNVGASSTKTFTLQNTTSSAITFSSIVYPVNVTRATAVAGDCPTTTSFSLGAGQSCVIRVTWKPTNEGLFSDQIKLISNYGSSFTATVATTGSAIIPVGTLTALGGACSQPYTFMDTVHNELVDGVYGWFLGWDTRYATVGNAYIYGVDLNSSATPGCNAIGTTADNNQVPPTNLKIYQTYARSTTQEAIVYNSSFDAYITLGYLADTNGVNPNTLGTYNLMNYMIAKPRGGVSRVYYYNNAQSSGGPLGKVNYYQRLRLFSSYDNSISLVTMVDGTRVRVFTVDLNNSYGLSEIVANPYYADTAIANVPAAEFVYKLTYSGGGMFMDGNDPYTFWVYSNLYGVFTYNSRTGAISYKHDKSKASVFANVRTMDTQGFMYAIPGYTNTSPAITSYTIRKIDSATAVSTNLASFSATLPSGSYAMPFGMFLSADQRYLYITGSPLRYRLKIRQ